MRPLLTGAALVGLLDFAYATIFAVSQGRPWYRPWLSVASAVLGREAFNGGDRTVILGIVLHFVVATCIVTAYMIAARVAPALRRQIPLLGPIYGGVIYAVMNFVVIPLSRIGSQPFTWSPFTIGAVLLHLVLLGPAAVYFGARAASSSGP